MAPSSKRRRFKKCCVPNGGQVLNPFREFAQNTSMHGLKYTVQDDKHWIERAAWVVVFVGGLCFSGYFCQRMWQRWQDSPILMSLETNRYPLSNINFPSVTICSANKISKRRLQSYLQDDPKWANVTYDMMVATLRYMTRLDRASDFSAFEDLVNVTILYHSLGVTPEDLLNIMNNTSIGCRDIMKDIVWMGLELVSNPDLRDLHMISNIPTDDGLCCTFNGADYNDTELGINASGFDYKVGGTGYRNQGMSFVLHADISDYSVTNYNFDGFRVLIHTRNEFPDVAERGIAVGSGFETFIAVKGVTTFHTEDVAKKLDKERRKCVVENELNLIHFPNYYSQSACYVECAIEKMKEMCLCRPYNFRGDKETPLCSLSEYRCASFAYESIRDGKYGECPHCKPPCTDIWYEPEISYAPFPGGGFRSSRTYKRLKEMNAIPNGNQSEESYLKSNFAMLHVYYKEKTGMRYKTDIRFGTEDFVSAMGGLLGLGLGVSFISIVELMYFFGQKVFCFFTRRCPSCGSKPDTSQSGKCP